MSFIKWMQLFVLLKISSVSSMVFGVSTTAKNVIDHFSAAGGTNNQFLAGKTALVTGGNSGIGLETCKALASAGCKVILCTRSIQSANAAIETEIKADGLGGYSVINPNIIVKQLDLENLSSVKTLAEEVMSEEKSVDYLVLNAGIMSLPTLQRTSFGWEKQMGVNHFGHAYLTKLLLPFLIKQEPNARIVVLASTAHRFSSSGVVADLQYTNRRYVPWEAYGDSKMANLLYTRGLAKYLDDKGIKKVTAMSVHPGVIKTKLWNQSIVNRIFSVFVGDRDIPQGAASQVWACVAPRAGLDEMRGAYISDCAPQMPNALACDDSLRESVWRVTESEILRAEAIMAKI